MTEINNGLWKAADVLNLRGFVKNALENEVGVCAMGAYGTAYDHALDDNSRVVNWADSEHVVEMAVLAETIQTLFPDRYSSYGTNATKVTMFNDHSDTTKEDVIKVFRVAGVKLATGI